MRHTRTYRFGVAAIAILALLLQGTWVLAETTGQITGTLTDTQTARPIAGAHVTAQSPSQSAATTTDAQGRFAFLALPPDTYSVTATANGYETTVLNGITVQADQVQTAHLTAPRSLQRIGHTTSRSAADVVRPGQTADVYSVNAAQASASAALGGGGALNQAYSAIASVPGVFVPIGQQGWAQAVYVRGGNYTQLGYDYDGVPVQRAYDAYPSSTLSSLGNQEIQVYTGNQPAAAQSNGLAGFVNQVIKTGTYPGTAYGEGDLGSPTFYHKAQAEIGGASPDRNFSYYVGLAGYDQRSRVLDNFDAASYQGRYGFVVPIAVIAHNCANVAATAGCYSNAFGSAPSGYVFTPLSFGQDDYLGDRETVANLHFGLPHPKDGLKDDVQLLGSVSYLFTNTGDSYASYGPAADAFFNTGVLHWNGATYPSCTRALIAANVACANNLFGLSPFTYPDFNIYTGPSGPLTAGNLGHVSQYLYPAQPAGTPLGAPVPANEDGTSKINDAIFKLQYTHPMGANAYARAYVYSLYSDWLNNDPNGIAFVPADYILPTHTRGGGLQVADQLGSHLLNLTGGYSSADLSRWNNGFPTPSNPVAVLVNANAPTAGCYSGAAAPVLTYCGSAARYVVPPPDTLASAGLMPVGNGPITAANASSFRCGSGPCEFLTVGSGLNGSYNNVTPRFSNLTLSDSWSVTPRLQADLSLRWDGFAYDIPSGTTPEGPNPAGTASAAGRALFTTSYDQFTCFSKTTGPVRVATPYACPAGTSPVNFTNANPGSLWYAGFQPRIGATYTLGTDDVLRIGYGKFLQPSSTAYVFYNRAGADLASYDVNEFYAYGYTSATHPIPPAVSYNLDFSWEHQIRGSDVSWKVSPFLRRTHDEDVTVVLDPTTNFSSAIPALGEQVSGVELMLRKGDFNRNGFAAQISYTYTYARAKFEPLPGGNNALQNVNNAIRSYNAYTSFCAAHASDPRCGTPSNGVAAAPCYTSSASAAPDTPVAACGAGDIANPYWNAPVQPLFDVNAWYVPYNQTFSNGLTSTANASSYVIPHVVSGIFSYRHDRWSFTPSLQFTAGGRYGSPLMGIGVDPGGAACAPLPGETSTANDPRYPYGSAGGVGYLAQTCGPGYLVQPDPFTHRFDSPGAFVEPSQLVANLGISYRASSRLTLSVLAINVFGTCFGGTSAPWTTAGPKLGCWYNAAAGVQAGNFYNPGNGFTAQAYPYFPVIGAINGQQYYGTNVQPLQLVVSAQLRM